jgi:EXLDI family protein
MEDAVPNKTIYVSDEDLPLYEQAQQMVGGNLSAAIARALRRFVQAEQDRHSGYREVTVRVGTGQARRVQRFSGFLLGEWRHPTAERRIERFRVYRTRKGRFALHVTRMPDWAGWADPGTWDTSWDRDWSGSSPSGGWWEHDRSRSWWGPAEETLDVGGDLEELRDKLPAEFYDTLASEAGRPAVEELDI